MKLARNPSELPGIGAAGIRGASGLAPDGSGALLGPDRRRRRCTTCRGAMQNTYGLSHLRAGTLAAAIVRERPMLHRPRPRDSIRRVDGELGGNLEGQRSDP